MQYGCGGLQLQNQDMVVSESNFAGQLCLLVKNATSECFVACRVYAWGQHAWSFSKMLIKSRHIVPGLANWLERGFPDVN